MTSLADFSAAQLADYFEYLDELRESGETNMFGAVPYLIAEYDLGRNDASAVLQAWMKTFSDSLSPADRAMNAIEASTSA